MVKKASVVFACFIFLVLFANNIIAPPPKALWYQVDDWEKEVCSKWGGAQSPVQEAVTFGRVFSYGALSATVQGNKFRTPENNYIYDVAYYIDSFAEDTDYEILLVNPARADVFKRVAGGRLAPGAGKAGFETYNLTQDFTHIKLTYTGGHIMSPIMQVK